MMSFRLLLGTYSDHDPDVRRRSADATLTQEVKESAAAFRIRCAKANTEVESDESFDKRRTRVYAGAYRDEKGQVQPGVPKGHFIRDTGVVSAGYIIETNLNLTAMFNQPGAEPKFERLIDTAGDDGLLHQKPGESIEDFAARIQRIQQGQQQTSTATLAPEVPAVVDTPSTNFSDTLESMSLDELRKLAAEDEIDLKNARTKKEVIEILKKAEPSMVRAGV